jgi:hypothetical protein
VSCHFGGGNVRLDRGFEWISHQRAFKRFFDLSLLFFDLSLLFFDLSLLFFFRIFWRRRW